MLSANKKRIKFSPPLSKSSIPEILLALRWAIYGANNMWYDKEVAKLLENNKLVKQSCEMCKSKNTFPHPPLSKSIMSPRWFCKYHRKFEQRMELMASELLEKKRYQ